MTAFRRTARMGALAMALALTSASTAQTLQSYANCNRAEFSDMQQFQAELCTAHAGCRFTLALSEKGCSAVRFLRKIGDFFTRKKDIDNSDVVDAFEPEYPQTPKTRSIVQKAREAAAAQPPANSGAYRQNNLQIHTGNGNYASYDGGWNYTKQTATGGGTLIRPDTGMSRGNWVDGNLSGAGHRIVNGEVLGGEFQAGQLSGDGFKASPTDGQMETVEGTFDKGVPVGEVVRNYPDGSSVREIWEGGKMIARGERAAKGLVPPPVLRPEEAAAQKAAAETDAKIAAAKNAGELFALADELDEKGDSAGARKALRALVSRYPDSPLAAAAASRLSNMGSTSGGSTAPGGGAAGSGNPASAGGAGSIGASPCLGSEQAMADEIGRKVDAYSAQNPGPTSNSTVEKIQYLLFLYAYQRQLMVSYEKCLTPDRFKLALHEHDTITVAQTKRTCEQIASSPSVCVARYDPAWRR